MLARDAGGVRVSWERRAEAGRRRRGRRTAQQGLPAGWLDLCVDRLCVWGCKERAGIGLWLPLRPDRSNKHASGEPAV